MQPSQADQIVKQMQQFAGQVQQAVVGLQTQINIVRKRLTTIEANEALRREKREPRFAVEFRSQFGEDLAVWDLLGGQTTGFFIECGAFDGYHYSVTYALEALGWSGLLVEALPKCCQECTDRRKHSRVVNAALGKRGSSGATTFTVVDDQYGGMLSYRNADTDHARQLQQQKAPTKQISVPFTTMNDLLKDHTGTIDVAVIDVEGAEVEVLDGFDLARYKPRLLLLEDNSHGADPKLSEFMKNQPYVEVGRLAVNRIFVHKDEQAVLNRARG